MNKLWEENKIYDVDYLVIEEEDYTPINKTTNIVISVIMAVLGLLAFLAPLPFGIGLSYIITTGLGIYGISQIAAFITTPAAVKNGWKLGNGIVLTLFSALILWTSFGKPYGSIEMLSVLTFSIGFFTLVEGVSSISLYSKLKTTIYYKSGWLLAEGILNLLLTAILIINPIISWLSLSVIWGIYLMISAIVLFIQTRSSVQQRL